MASAKCALCGSGQVNLYLDSDKILTCQHCGVIFLAPDQIPANLDAYYQDNPFYAQNASNPELLNWMVKTACFYLRTITEFARPATNRLLVDVGSNYGVLVEEAAKIGFRAIGLEKNSWLIAAGRPRGLNISTTDLSKLTEPVDVITMMHVLEHLTNPRSLIREASQKLTPDGILFIGVPNIESHLAKKDGLSWRYIALEHLFYFSPAVLTELLKSEGFEVLEIKPDGSNLTDLSLKKLVHYLFGPALQRDRFQMKSWTGRSATAFRPSTSWKKILKKVLIFIIKILRHEDFILIIGRKVKLRPALGDEKI